MKSDLIIQNMKRAIAESCAELGDYETADLEFKKLVKEFPNSPWGYIGWRDIFFV